MALGGPALYLVGEGLLRVRVVGAASAPRVAVAALLLLAEPIASALSALALSAAVKALLVAVVFWERRAAGRGLGARLGPPTDANLAPMGDL